MGIDAKMLIRYRGEKPSDTDLTRWSWDLCRSIGARHFFISDGLPTEQYEKAEKAWQKDFESHARYAAYDATYKAGNLDRGIWQEIIDDIGESPKQLRRAIDFSGAIWAQPGEWLLNVSLWTRYYGPGYERGDTLTICAIAEWVELNLQPCEVWYGADSSGVLVEPFGPAERAAMRAHLYGRSGRDYFMHGEKRGTFPTPKPCGLCVPGENRFNRHGWGGGYVAVNCAGCGKSFESRDNGTTWEVKKED